MSLRIMLVIRVIEYWNEDRGHNHWMYAGMDEQRRRVSHADIGDVQQRNYLISTATLFSFPHDFSSIPGDLRHRENVLPHILAHPSEMSFSNSLH